MPNTPTRVGHTLYMLILLFSDSVFVCMFLLIFNVLLALVVS